MLAMVYGCVCIKPRAFSCVCIAVDQSCTEMECFAFSLGWSRLRCGCVLVFLFRRCLQFWCKLFFSIFFNVRCRRRRHCRLMRFCFNSIYFLLFFACLLSFASVNVNFACLYANIRFCLCRLLMSYRIHICDIVRLGPSTKSLACALFFCACFTFSPANIQTYIHKCIINNEYFYYIRGVEELQPAFWLVGMESHQKLAHCICTAHHNSMSHYAVKLFNPLFSLSLSLFKSCLFQ